MPKKITQKIVHKKRVFARLASHVIPLHYAITLKPDLESHVFSGHETITLRLSKPSKSITLHSRDLNIKSAVIITGKNKIEATDISYDLSSETVTFMFATSLPAGNMRLSIVFEGVLADNMRGFYKSQYVVDGEQRMMAVTQFEATDARRAFPCFDEPAQKAVFDVDLIIPSGKMAISNTLPTSVIEHDVGYKIVSFASTPKMSTYLLAFIIGDFELVEQRTSRGVLVRVLTVPGKSHQATFALDVTVRCLEFYEQYFDIPYPLNTLDMIAIPDFSSLAMENWGAITFREIALLFDEGNTSTSYKQMVALVIAHELAHQWFGNLVTMEWWTHLWLNEGFATYIEHLAVAELFPEYDIWSQFVVGSTGHGLEGALVLDALANTHPIEIPVNNPNEIGEIFDAVSYDKGSAVIRMLADYLGEKDFRNGLRYYLKKHSYKNASTIHLWEAFEKVSKKPVKKMMSVWTGKSGYPIVSVESLNGKLTLSQKRYFSNPTKAKKISDSTLWPIPLSAITKDGVKKFDLMSKRKITMPTVTDSWIKFNAYEGSLYRTQYDKKSLLLLREALESRNLSSSDRLGIVRDAIALSGSGEVSAVAMLELLPLYKDETEYVVWIPVISGLYKIANLLAGKPAYTYFAAYAREVLANTVGYVGWDSKDGEPTNMPMLREAILGAAVYFENQQVLAVAMQKFNNRNEIGINADIRGVVYVAAALSGDEREYEVLLDMYRNETLHEEKERILRALGKFKNKKLITRTLEFILSDHVRMQERNRAFAGVLTNPLGRELAWKFIQKNWKKIGEAYGDGNHLLSRLISYLDFPFTREAYKNMESFFKTHHAPAGERTVQQTLEYIDSNIHFLKREETKITQWLRNRK